MRPIRNLTPWPPPAWRRLGDPATPTPAAVLVRPRVDDRGIHMHVREDGREFEMVVPLRAEKFKEIAVAILGAAGMTVEEIGEIEVG